MGKVVLVIDAQGGGLGRQLINLIRREVPDVRIIAVGTNYAATAAMLKAGADFGATGENPVIRNVMDADLVLGPMGIVVAHAILGEVTPAMAEAVGGCRARKLLIPMNSCGVCVAGVQELPLNAYVAQIVEQVRQMEN
jgi:hypothetical protein